MKGYADLLREAQARQNAEARAQAAEAKLDAIRKLHDTRYVDSGDDETRYYQVRAILDGTK